MSRTTVVLGLFATATVATATILGTRNSPIVPTASEPVRRLADSTPISPEANKLFADKTMAALDVLKNELNRRFTDRQNVDFGMSRMVREGQRMHNGPTAEVTQRYTKRDEEDFREKDGRYQQRVDGEWIDQNLVRPRMTPENDKEKAAIATLRNGEVYTALYTVGRFEYDDGKPVAKPVDKGYVDFGYFGGEQGSGLRAKGPAYLAQKGEKAPAAWEIVQFGRKAWALGAQDFDAAGPNGWHFFAHKVKMTDESCARCHAVAEPTVAQAQAVQTKKVGDNVGMFVVALKLKS